MEKLVNSKEVEELRWKDVSIDSGSMTEDLLDDNSRECGELEFNEQIEFESTSGGENQENVLGKTENNLNREDKIVMTTERMNNNSSKMDEPSLIDVKIEYIDTSNSSLDDFRNGDTKNDQFVDEDGTVWMEENKFLFEDHIKMEVDDSFPEYIDHYTAEMEEDTKPENVYCNYCERNVLSKNLASHLTYCHKDAKGIEKLQKHIHCRFCGIDVFSKNLMRHLERHHYEENEVQKILAHPTNSKERRHAIALFRNKTNVDLFVTEKIRPYRLINRDCDNEYFPCVYCMGVYTKKDLEQHRKFCFLREKRLEPTEKWEKDNYLPTSQSITKCDGDHGDIINRLNVKEQVFHLMRKDLIASEAKRDIVIAHVGEHFLNDQTIKYEIHTVISRMRELSCLLIAYRSLVEEQNLRFIDIIDANNFSKVLRAVKIIAGYDEKKKTFNCPNLATNIFDSLKLICTMLVTLISTENLDETMVKTEWIEKVNIFKNLLETQWNDQLFPIEKVKSPKKIEKQPSLLQVPVRLKQKRKKVPKEYSLLHLAVHLKQFQEDVLRIAYQCQEELFTNIKNEDSYKLLVQASLALLYISNKQNVEEIQYILVEDYLDENKAKYVESKLSNVERVLTAKHKQVLVSTKADENVLILIPYVIQCFINVLLKHRDEYIEADNRYIFAMPGSDVKWGESEVAIRNLCQTIKLEEKSIADKGFSKYRATIIGILNLSQGELQQLGHFMGCVLQSKKKFFELPLDAYQTAKLSRFLQIMEEQPILPKYMGNCLAEIDIDPNDEFACDDIADVGENEDSLPIDEDQCKMDVVENSTHDTYQQDIADNMNVSPNWKNGNEHSSEKDQVDSFNSSEHNEAHKDEFHNSTEKMFELRRESSHDNGCKRGWTNEEIELIVKEFNFWIDNGVYPSGKAMNKFLLENNITKTVPTLRSKIQHLIRMKHKF